MSNKNKKISALNLQEFKTALAESKAIIVDTRLPDFFELGFIPGSLNFGFNQQYSHLSKSIFGLNQKLILITKAADTENALSYFSSLENLQIIGYFEDGSDKWIDNNEKFDMIISISSEELCLDSKHNPKAIIIDVREKEEFDALHVKVAQNIPLSELTEKLKELDNKAETLIYCDKGYRSMIAASILKANGFINIKNVWGGFEQIVHEKIELTTNSKQ